MYHQIGILYAQIYVLWPQFNQIVHGHKLAFLLAFCGHNLKLCSYKLIVCGQEFLLIQKLVIVMEDTEMLICVHK